MKPRKRSSLFSFIFSFLPGAAEMYMGFFKNGFTLLALFVLGFIIPATLYGADVLFTIPLVIYVFGFFHARALAKCPDEEFDMIEDKYIWEELINERGINIPAETSRRWLAVILIIIGLCAVWANLENLIGSLFRGFWNDREYEIFNSIFNRVPQFAFAIAAIWGGVKLIGGKKNEIDMKLIEEKRGN